MDELAIIQRAFKECDPDCLRQLFEEEEGVSVDSRDDEGRTFLHRAAEEGWHFVAELLIRSKCDLNIKDHRGRTPVLLAAECEKRPVVDLLLQRGAQVNCADEDKYTLLHYASRWGWTDLVQSILDKGETDISAVTSFGRTPLFLAANGGHDDVAALLIRAGADVNRSNGGMKETALHVAALFGSTRVVQVLLEKEGLNLNPQDVHGFTPLHWACFQRESREIVIQLLVAGADTTIMNDDNGETALSGGIKVGRITLEDIRLFLHHGAFLQECDYVRIYQNPDLKESVLRDVGLCTQSIVNKFHRQSLPALKSITYFARKLPNIDKFQLNARQVDEVENLVRCEIRRNTFCNIVKAHPMALSALSVLSLITCRSGTKRSASPDLNDSNSPFKKLHT